MQIALRLAKRGVGSVEPNPAVGAVIVKDSRIIGRGWHKKFGGPHAEINALEDCKTLGANPQGATMYVTLEPCCHHAKTPPCTDPIIAAGLAKVVVATVDPSEHANGKGIAQLRNAGIEVQLGVCETQVRVLNAPFIKFATTGKCWVILKWAQTIDGKLAYSNETDERQWISNEQSRKDAHKLRRRTQAILVGINTIIADDPLLTPRPSRGKKPTRVVLDSRLRISLDCKLLASAKKAPVLILTSEKAFQANPQIAQQINRKGAELLVWPNEQGQSNLHFLLDELSKRGVQQLLVEGGPTVLTSFLKEQLADEIIIYIAPKILGERGNASLSEAMSKIVGNFDLHNVEIEVFGGDVRLIGLTDAALKQLGRLGTQNKDCSGIKATQPYFD